MEAITVRLEGRSYRAEVDYGRFHWVSDEPLAAGGSNEGPDPYAYLLGALGSCMAITLSMYAKRKSWELRSVDIDISHSGNYADDCLKCETDDARLKDIKVEVKIGGIFTEDQQKRLKEIVKKCPVHKTLSGSIKMDLSTTFGG